MDLATTVSIALAILGGVFSIAFGIIGYLLRQKDSEQAEQIRMLFTELREQQRMRQELELRIASHYYMKDELDKKFDKLENTLSEGLLKISTQIDKMSSALMKHIMDEDDRK